MGSPSSQCEDKKVLLLLHILGGNKRNTCNSRGAIQCKFSGEWLRFCTACTRQCRRRRRWRRRNRSSRRRRRSRRGGCSGAWGCSLYLQVGRFAIAIHMSVPVPILYSLCCCCSGGSILSCKKFMHGGRGRRWSCRCGSRNSSCVSRRRQRRRWRWWQRVAWGWSYGCDLLLFVWLRDIAWACLNKGMFCCTIAAAVYVLVRICVCIYNTCAFARVSVPIRCKLGHNIDVLF
jgi:hypothetical protein